jgi:PST family polysaccharide transporter
MPDNSQQTGTIMEASPARYERWFQTDELRPHLKTKSIRGGAWVMVSSSANLAISLAATSVLARILVPTDFGLLGMVFALTVIAEQFKDIGLGRATVQKRELTHAEVTNLFWLNFLFGLGICLAISLLSGAIARFYHEPRLTLIAASLSITFAFSGLVIQHQALLNRHMKFFATGLIGTGALAASNVLAIILALRGYGYWSLVWRELARSVLVAIATFAACPWLPGRPDFKHTVWPQMRFGRDITVFNIVVYLTSSVDQILLGRFGGANILGIYRQAFQLVTLPINQLSSSINSVSEPLFSALQNDPEKYRRGFRKAVNTLGLITMPLAAGFFMCSDQVVALLLGQSWTGAADVARILAAAMFIKPVFSSVGFVMVTCGKTGRYVAAGILDSIVLIAAVAVGVLWGARGVAMGHVVATYLVFLPLVWWTLEDTPVGLALWLKSVARPAISSIIMVAVLYAISAVVPFTGNLALLSTKVAVGAAVYFLAMLMLPRGREDLTVLLTDIHAALK